ncbi:MAG TPA: Slp family lipoprotein [Gammaproteobacteria bacterium]|nr:Slp family lipoprotein [Gammaproteobacteria bacterium]
MNIRPAIILGAALLLGGCASNLPKPIADKPAHTVPLKQARQDIEANKGVEVRWGGTVASVRNFPQRSEVEVVSRPLYANGRPKDSDQSDGRFIAVVRGFIDPDVYQKGRQVTVHGVIDGAQSGKIDAHDYRYPRVDADTLYLWPKLREDCADYYDPWFYPWGYPAGYWPSRYHFFLPPQ